jgi:hypothetical protein
LSVFQSDWILYGGKPSPLGPTNLATRLVPTL